MKELINFEDYITASGAYKDRLNSPELTKELKNNSKILLEKVNGLLEELGINAVRVSSGFRPSEINAGIGNAAKKSLHMRCLAVDILDDKNQTLAKKILMRPDLLKKYDIWLEDPTKTMGAHSNWVHCDIGDRKDRPLRIFKP